MWILGNVKSIVELGEWIVDLNVMEVVVLLLNIVVLLYWIISDKSGFIYVLELENDGVYYMKNLVGVMMNILDFEWYFKNLSNYVNL